MPVSYTHLDVYKRQAKALAHELQHVVYLDKDTLIVLSKQIFKVAGQP